MIPDVDIRKTIIISVDETPIVTAAEAGDWLNLSASMITAKTDMLNSLIKSAEEAIVNFTWLTLHETVYESQQIIDSWGEWFTLERSPITAIGEVSFLNGDVYEAFDKGTTTADGLYPNITERITSRGWAEMKFINPPAIQDRTNAYRIKTRFTAGMKSDTIDTVPEGIKTAIKMIVASYFTNRGDCDCSIGGFPIPCAAFSILNPYSIQRTVL